MISSIRRVLKALHPEAIPWPGTVLYNRIAGSRPFEALYELLANEIGGLCREGKLLDIGTGPGFLLIKLQRLYPELRLAGVDISAAMVAVARRNVQKAGLSGRIEIIEAPAGHLPFPGGFFDSVVSTGSLHHWKDQVRCLNEVHRVLRTGGRALIYDLTIDIPKEKFQELSNKFGRLRAALFWLHTFEEPFLSSKELQSLAESSLFRHGGTSFESIMCRLEMVKG